MELQKIKIKILFRKNLFNRLGALVLIFTFALISLLWYQFNYAHVTQDSILDAHENYFLEVPKKLQIIKIKIAGHMREPLKTFLSMIAI